MVNKLMAGFLALGVLAGPVAAQDVSLRPTFGTLDLRENFQPDPRSIDVTAGGTLNAERLGNGCTGSIANPPDVRLNYEAGRLPLYISVQSGSDTTLVVNLPDGSWVCNDDFIDLNPGIVLNRPASGQYDIWIGVFGGGAGQPAKLLISEVPPRR
ncbi:peptidase S1 [Roseococcus sp. SDR]|uniref:peptidase S1 n=1 Tax=Roseococcus sp. SDR TaxID=2835532 RepID=UPI001BCF56D9|nr:peptidase S1 [Roseococcus sp. SDR]MBS7788455.1 peptidase S1 [Roseococcus sp. SDR]MBV1843769.1 peptidase S1 [Roseococcus sp. SDR]